MHHKKRSGKSSHTHEPSSRRQDLISNAYKLLKAGKPVAASHMEHHDEPFESVREVKHNGHNIVVRTTYEIEVDGKPVKGHVYVDNRGRVYTHAMPAYSFTSTIDLIKKLIDAFPDNFPNVSRKISRQPSRHSHHRGAK